MNKRVALMQPYFFPYLGYWQMMNSVDTFIIYDTVQFTRGWMNRNRFRSGGEARWMTLPVAKGELTAQIPERKLGDNYPWARRQIVDSLAYAYRTAPHRERGMALVSGVLDTASSGTPLIDLLLVGLEEVRSLLRIVTPMVLSSTVPHNAELGRSERVMDLVRAVEGTTYYSLSGARSLYSPRQFARNHLDIVFREFNDDTDSGTGERALSIIDLIMRYDLEEIQEMLNDVKWAP